MTDFHRQAMLPMDEAPCHVEHPTPHLPEAEQPGNARLAAEGWQRRFVADGARLAEYVELYTSLGFEVLQETIEPEEIGPECADCRLVICRQYVTLYTRPRA
ncbi:MAG: hypothetical protein IT317_22180 [Anaerolineales bacterium]|nr:hypothetical protein [Anaerolineales bacterium]